MADVITITDSAVDRMQTLIENASEDVIGLRLSISTKGCNGYSYDLKYVSEHNNKDDLIERDGVKLYVDPLAFMYIFGTTMDWEEGKMESTFTFINPNEKSRCGCGESFSI